MRLKAFRVQMYRPILDSDWVEVDDVTAIVGKNESGKTSLLKALHKFNPHDDEPFSLDNEWPINHRSERRDSAEVVITKFDFDTEELNTINTLCNREVSGVTITKTYNGEFLFTFYPDDDPFFAVSESDVNEQYMTQTELIQDGERDPIVEHFFDQIRGIGFEIINGERSEEEINLITRLAEENLEISDADDLAKAIVSSVQAGLESNKLINAREKAEGYVVNWLPKFVYMDEHKPFTGSAHLTEIQQRIDSGLSKDQDDTFQIILKLAGLDLATEIEKLNQHDNHQRMLDMNEASRTLTELLAKNWSQRDYNVKFQADNDQIMVFIEDDVQKAMVPLEDRSMGFQWFFSFDTRMLYETNGAFEKAVVLLDEPGLHLHASAQADLLRRMKDYSLSNQFIYTTHMPFMLDLDRLDNIRVCSDDVIKGTTVTNQLFGDDRRELLPLQAALGLYLSQSPLFGEWNLVVEGVTDMWFLNCISHILKSSGRVGLNDRVVITPGNSASRATYVVTLLQFQGLKVMVLLDSDESGKTAAEELRNKWTLDSSQILCVGDILKLQGGATIEDAFPTEFYVDYVNRVFAEKLGDNLITLNEINGSTDRNLVDQIENVFRRRNIKRMKNGKAFNKGTVAKVLYEELPKKSIKELPDELIENFDKIFRRVNEQMTKITVEE